METAGSSWWESAGKKVGPPFAVYATNEVRRHNIRIRKHNSFMRSVTTDNALKNGTWDLDRYVPTQIKVNEVSPTEVSASVKAHFKTMSRKDQARYDHWNLEKHGGEIQYQQTWLQKLNNDGSVVVTLKDKKEMVASSNSKPPVASISQTVEAPIFKPVYTIGCAPPKPYYYKSPSTAQAFDSPWGSLVGFVFIGSFIWIVVAVKNRIETGSFFPQKMSPIEILAAYKNKNLSLNQACILLKHMHFMSTKVAVEFLTDPTDI